MMSSKIPMNENPMKSPNVPPTAPIMSPMLTLASMVKHVTLVSSKFMCRMAIFKLRLLLPELTWTGKLLVKYDVMSSSMNLSINLKVFIYMALCYNRKHTKPANLWVSLLQIILGTKLLLTLQVESVRHVFASLNAILEMFVFVLHDKLCQAFDSENVAFIDSFIFSHKQRQTPARLLSLCNQFVNFTIGHAV